MESQQLVDYIDEQIKAGYSEGELRPHLMAHGWSATAVDGAFAGRQQRDAPEPEQPAKSSRTAKLLRVLGTKSKKSSKPRQHRVKASKWTKQRWLKLSISVVVLAAAGLGARAIILDNTSQLLHLKPLKLSYRQLQVRDVSTVGGAVALYASETQTLPTNTVVLPDGHLQLCGATCDGMPEVNVLTSYQPAGVEIKPYTIGLVAPSKSIMYLVPQAKCANQTTLGEPSPNPRSMVILYQQADGNQLKPRCVPL
ncbi:MAG TPA: hypothetical protein VLF69_04920 [Candidatus Saccharimonadales bacterium]|nr:hypothetical protein [Candidatus Saccharimonadales bacterium]